MSVFNKTKSVFVTIILCFMSCGFYVQAQEAMELSVQINTENSGPQGREEALTQAYEELSWKALENYYGAAFIQKNKNNLKSRVVSQSQKYILSARAVAQNSVQNQWMVFGNVSRTQLESLLREEGLLSLMEGPPKVLYLWKHSEILRQEAFHEQLKKLGFFIIDGQRPSTQMNVLPGDLNTLTSQDIKDFANRTQVNAVMVSQLKQENGQLQLQATLYQGQTGRKISEITRLLKTDKSFAENLKSASNDLAHPLLQMWKSGQLNALQYRLVVEGNLTPNQVDQVRKILTEQVREIRSMKERVFQRERFEFEVEATKPTSSLAEIIRKQQWVRFKLTDLSSTPDTVVLNIKPI